MKKLLPIILLIAGLLVVGLVFFAVSKNKAKVASNTEEDTEDNEVVAEISMSDRPFTTLTPSADGHWLKLNVVGIKNSPAKLEYELMYIVSDGRTQGVPGIIDLKGESSIERNLLMGSESSGKFRYDAGVEKGTLTLKFRNEKGKLTGKLVTDFKLYNNNLNLNSADDALKFTLDKADKKTFFVVMSTFGLPSTISGNLDRGPFAILASSTTAHLGKADLGDGTYQMWDGSTWKEFNKTTSVNSSVFVSTK